MQSDITYKLLTEDDFNKVIRLGNDVHGKGYLSHENLSQWRLKGIEKNINTSYVAYCNETLVGFRITFSANSWPVDKWCSPQRWQVPIDKVCYFKCNTVDEQYRRLGIGGKLLKLSIFAAQKQGALAGISHLWKDSPGNNAVMYFTKCGGQLVKSHPDRWYKNSKQGWECGLCGFDCHCEAAEMIIYFDK